MFGLSDFLMRHESVLWQTFRGSYYTPGYFVALAALARQEGRRYEDLEVDASHEGYCSAIRLPCALGSDDTYPFARPAAGQNYAPLVLLENADATDRATADVNGCIRNLCSDLRIPEFIGALCSVVGDLHDNVWSHGMSTGFSQAQRWRHEPWNHQGEYCLEFALADCGYGFQRELERVGLRQATDGAAIEWCIQPGNSTKLPKATDGWEQRLPQDMMGNPMPGVGRIQQKENNHQGLGLAKLVSLVEHFKGELWLASGNSLLQVGSNGQRQFLCFERPWPGVCIACRFNTVAIKQAQVPATEDDITHALIELLGEANEPARS